MRFIENILNIIISPDLQKALLPFKIVAIIFSLLLLGAIIYFLCITTYLEQLYFSEWKDYKHWRKTYGPEAKREKKRLLKQTSEEGKQEINFTNKVKENNKPQQDVLEVENLRQGRIERTDWERVLDRLETKSELNYKLALIDADKIFIQILKKYGKEFSSEAISNFDKIMEARQVLEKMLNNPKAVLTKERAKELISVYGKALKEMGDIDV